MKKSLQATGVRSALIVLVLFTLGGASAAFYFGFGWIKSYATEVNTVVVAAAASGDTANSIDQLQERLERQQEIISTANSLFALTSTYQTQAIKDIYTYAGKTGISVSDIKLDEVVASGEAAPAGTGSSLPTKAITISLDGSVPYTALLRFLSYIETNIPKMQISGVELSRPDDGSDNVTISSITIGIYVR